ncbi:MAG: ribose-phosphate pyrophosphokinase, partial [Mediterranea sp.]|nr:ribose-phosphate pyrophosphokinase [Mediterranea sp.]
EAITVSGQRLAIHEVREGKQLRSTQVINFDNSFFAGKEVVVFDDVITQGRSYAKFACAIEALGASVVGGIFLGRTI